MSSTQRARQLAARLVAEDASIEEKQQCANEFRDNVEELMTGASAQQSGVIESLTRVLETIPPQHEVNYEHKLRKSILEVINRIPHTEVLKEHVSKLARALLNVATEDNQENAIVAVKVVVDLLRAFKPGIDEVATPLIQLFTQLYDQWEKMYKHYFVDLNRREGPTELNMDMEPSRRSFRVIAECPITVLHLVQLYGNDIRIHVPSLIALMVRALRFEGSAEIRPFLQQAYKDMKFAQVKTVAFLSHYVKQSVHLMQPHEQEICDGLMNLLKSCPDVVQWRRELLISTRTLLATDFRKSLDVRLNDLKDESAIVGSSRSCYEALRHYGYAVFAELAHQTRQTLKLDQLSWIVHRSCCIISDTERPASSHSTAVRLLLHLVEVIHRQRFGPNGSTEIMSRKLLQKILLCLATKLNFVKRTKKMNSEVQLLFVNLFLGLRTVLYSLTGFSRRANSPAPGPTACLTEQEIRFAVKIVKGGIEGLKMCLKHKMQSRVTELMELFVDALNVLDPKEFVEILSARIDYIYTSLNTHTELHPIVSMILEKPKIGLHFLAIIAGYMADQKLELLADPEHEEYRFVLKLFRLLFHTLLKQVHNCMAVSDPKVTQLISTLIKITKICLEKTRASVACQGYLQLLWFLFRYLNRSRMQLPEMAVLLPSALDLFLSMLEGPDLEVPKDLLIELCLLLPLELEKKYTVLPKLMKPLLMALRGTDDLALLAIQTMEEWIDRLNPDFLEPAMAAQVQEINVALWSHLKPQQNGPLGPRVLQLLGKLGGRNRRFLSEPFQLDWKDNPDHGLRLILTFCRDDRRFMVYFDKCISLICDGLFARGSQASSNDPEHALHYRQQGMQFLHVCLSAMMNLPHIRRQRLSLEKLRKVIVEGAPLPVCHPPPERMIDQAVQTKSQYLAEKQNLKALITAAIMLCVDAELKEEASVFARAVCRHFALLFHLSPARESRAGDTQSFLHSVPGDPPPTYACKYLEPEIFIDAVIEVLTHEQTSVTKAAAAALSWFLEVLLEASSEKNSVGEVLSRRGEAMNILSGSPDAHKHRNLAKECGLPDVVSTLLRRIVDCCFGDNWAIRSGGIYGMEVLISTLPPLFLEKALPQLMRSLLHLMQALPSYGHSYRSLLRELMLKLVQRVVEGLAPQITGRQESEELTEAIGKLCTTIFQLNVQESVREDCHDCLELLCRSFQKRVVDVLDPSVSLHPKSLKRSLDECAQAAAKYQAHPALITAFASHMEGLSRLLIYCIQQRLPSVHHFLKQILECADFAVVLCEAPHELSTLRGSNAIRPERSSTFSRMKESALKMFVTLSNWDVFLSSADFAGSKKTLESMVRIFFNTLISPDDNLRQIAKTGLMHLIQGKRISQYDCQSSLKPILSRLNKFCALDLNVLKGGAEALRMLSDWFNLILGEKLLEHLKKWLQPESAVSPQRTWSPSEDSKIAAAILELFHLLPDSASSFLETQKSGTERIGLVILTIELEERLGNASLVGPIPHVLWSPYRAPLTKFLVKYKKEAVSYFLAPTRMKSASYVTRFIDIIKSDVGEPLLKEVMSSTPQLMALLQSDLSSSEGTSSALDVPSMACFHALQLIKTIVKLRPEWLSTQHALFQLLLAMWKELSISDRALREETMEHEELFESKAIAKCLLNYVSHHHHHVEPLVALLSVFESSSKVDFTFIKVYCMEKVPATYSARGLHDVLLYVLRQLNSQMSQGQAIFVLRFLVIPILQSLIKKGQMSNVVSQELIRVFVEQARNTEVQRDVCLEVELLDVGRLLTIGAPRFCDDSLWKDVLKYAWNFLKCENVECKSHAFLLVAYLLRTINLTDRTVLQVFVCLLKSDFAETKRELVQEALDVMVPALAERFERQTESGSFPLWMEHAIKHMMGEGHKLGLLMNLWQMVIGHPDLFYNYRSQFLGQMVNTLSRLRRPPTNANSENRQMAIDMERVIVDWEVRRVKGDREGTMDGVVSPPPLAEETFNNMKKMVVAFLAKTVFAVPPDKDSQVKYSYGDILGILSRALDVWPDVEFRLDFVDRLIEGSQIQHQSPAMILTAGLDLVSLALQHQPELFLDHGWHHLLLLAQKVVIMGKEEMVEKLCTALENVFAMEEMNSHMQEALEGQLLMKHFDASGMPMQQNTAEYEISSCLKIVEADRGCRTGMRRRFLSPLVRQLERYSKEYVIILQGAAAAVARPLPPTDMETGPMPNFGTQMYNVCKIVQLCGGALSDMGTNEREIFVVSMMRFLSWKGGRIPDRTVFYHVLTTVSSWLRDLIQNGESPAMSHKHLMWSMQQICRLDANGLVEPCMKRHFDEVFLTTIYDVCTSAGLDADFRMEVFAHVEQMLLCGIRTTTPDLREKFFSLYQGSLGTTLFERLKFILQTQDWEYVSSRFWLKQALDYLLAFLKEKEPVAFVQNCAQLAPFPVLDDLMPHEQPFNSDAMDVDSERPTRLDQLLTDHLQFIRNRSAFQTEDLMGPLREYAHVNPSLACHLWVLIFPIVWATLDRNCHFLLAKPIISILTKPYHAVQSHLRPNVIQGLLEGTSVCVPQPRIPPEIIKYLGKTYNAWHTAMHLLENHVVIFPEESRCFDRLAELYSLLSETDMMFGLWKKRCQREYTHAGINLMQYGYWDEALHVFGEATALSVENRMEADPREVALWSEEWCRCAKELNQWDELHSWAEASTSVALLADASWRLPDPDWMELRQLLQSAKEQFPDKLQYSMLMVYSASQERNTALCNTHVSNAIEQCLQKWWQLPEIGISGKVDLLQKFQQVVEVCESSRAFMELDPPRGSRFEQSGFTKEILETWRLRSPNVWEPLSVWSDVFIWRHIIYSSIASSISAGTEPTSPSLHHLCIKDKAWSINRLANVARKHGALDVCIEIENNMYNDSYMDVQEAFLKIVEQSKAYLVMEDQKLMGLTMLCSTNLDYFPYRGLQAQIFRLQGDYYRALDDPEMANQSYSTSITLNHQYPEAWLSWGAFCDAMYEKKKQEPNSVEYLEFAVGSYFQAMQLPCAAARAMIPRCLQLLSFDKTGTVSRVFEDILGGGNAIPPWYWLFYIPQILAVLHRPEGKSLRYVLPKIIHAHPQALFYFLRVHMLNMREAAYIAQGSRGEQVSGQGSQSDAPSIAGAATPGPSTMTKDDANVPGAAMSILHNFESVKEWMDRLKHQLGALSHTLEVLLREIASNFMAKPEERLMAVVHVLLARCCKVAGAQTTKVPQGLARELDGVCRACFPDTNNSTPMLRDLKESFVRHLNPTAEGFPETLGDLTDRLKKFRSILSRYLDDQMPVTQQLHRESPALQELSLHGVEMPCQYTKTPDSIVDAPVYLEKISSEIRTIRRQGSTFRRVALYDSEGRKTHFILQNGHTSGQPASSEERMLQLMCLMNRLFNKHHQCRSRFLSFFAPVIIPVWNKVRLVEEDPSFTTYLEAFEVSCQLNGKEPDHPVLQYKAKIYNGNDISTQRAQGAFEEITDWLSENIFSQYMYKILPSSNHLWVFKKQFCTQMALSSLMSVMLLIGGRIPGRILFSRASGKVLQVDFCPSINANGLVHQNEEPVPFRLTRNLATFFTSFGVEGIFMTSMVVAAMALTQRHSNLSACLSLFFRDELLAWASRKDSRSHFTSSMAQLQPLVEGNIRTAMENVAKLRPDVPRCLMEEPICPPIVNRGIKTLIEEATDPCKLCLMDPTWHPWY